MQEYKDLYNDFKFLALVPAKVATGIGVLVFIFLLLIFDLDFAENSFVGWNPLDIGLALFLVALAVITVKALADIQEYPAYYRKEYAEMGYDFQLSKKLTRYLQRLLRSKVDASNYISSAKRQNQIENNIIRFGSFVICFRNSIYIFILKTGGIDGRRDLNDLNDIARELANFTGTRNSSFQQFTTEYRPPLSINKRLVTYEVQCLSYDE